MAMIRKGSHDVGITEVHSQFDAGVFGNSIPVRQGDAVAEIQLVNGCVMAFKQNEVSLVNVKSMNFLGPVFDDPASAVSRSAGDVGSGCRIEHSRLMAFFGYVEGSRGAGTFCIDNFFGKI